MLSVRLTNCVECTTIPSLLSDIDCKLTEMAKNQYNNITLALNLKINSVAALDLLNYKRILEYKFCNPEYASCYSVESIANRVKILIHK